MEGIRAMKPSTKVAIEPTFSCKSAEEKKIEILRAASMNTGIKIVAHVFPGYL